MTIIGIDPGVHSGGIAVCSGNTMEAYPMPDGFTEIYDFLRNILLERGTPIAAILEDVGKGLPGQSSKATATFARHNGHLEMALYALGIRSVKVTPQKWQKHYSNTIGNSKGKTKTEWKNILKNEAKRRHPELKITLATADAVLLAEYGKQTTGQL